MCDWCAESGVADETGKVDHAAYLDHSGVL